MYKSSRFQRIVSFNERVIGSGIAVRYRRNSTAYAGFYHTIHVFILCQIQFYFGVFERHAPGQKWKGGHIKAVESVVSEHIMSEMLKHVG